MASDFLDTLERSLNLSDVDRLGVVPFPARQAMLPQRLEGRQAIHRRVAPPLPSAVRHARPQKPFPLAQRFRAPGPRLPRRLRNSQGHPFYPEEEEPSFLAARVMNLSDAACGRSLSAQVTSVLVKEGETQDVARTMAASLFEDLWHQTEAAVLRRLARRRALRLLPGGDGARVRAPAVRAPPDVRGPWLERHRYPRLPRQPRRPLLLLRRPPRSGRGLTKASPSAKNRRERSLPKEPESASWQTRGDCQLLILLNLALPRLPHSAGPYLHQ